MQLPEFTDRDPRFQRPSSAAHAQAAHAQAAPLDWSDKAVDFLFNANGRVSRGAYWLSGFVLVLVDSAIFAIVSRPIIALLSGTLDSLPVESPLYYLAQNLTLLVAFAIALWVNIALIIKRWHDLDRSGAWALIALVPLVGPLFQLVMCGFVAGTPGPNRFGPPVS